MQQKMQQKCNKRMQMIKRQMESECSTCVQYACCGLLSGYNALISPVDRTSVILSTPSFLAYRKPSQAASDNFPSTR